jgi:hypothetical protein
VNRRLCVVVLASVATLGAALRADGAPPVEGVLEVHGEAQVRADGTVAVDETILVLAAGEKIVHGVSQDIPTRHDDRRGERPGARPDVEVDVAGVTRDGQPETFAIEPIAGAVRVRIGDPRLPLSAGTHVYVVSYRTRNQIRFFADHDELAWNVTGDMGGLPVEQASAVVRLPVDAARAMAGLGGSISRPGSAAAVGPPSVVADRRGLAAVFTGRRRLAPHEALTAVVSWPKGFVAEPGLLARAVRVVREHRALLLALLALGLQVVCLRVARAAARWEPAVAPAPAGVTPAPPDALSPGALRFAVSGGADAVALAAALIGLADKGAVIVASGEAGALVVSRASGEEAAGATAAEERALAAALFAAGDAVRLERQSARVLAAARRALGDACAATAGERYFFGRAHHALPGLLLSVAALGALAAGAQGTRARAAAFALALGLLPWTAAAAGLVAGCARLWRWARGGRAVVWSALALAVVAAELAGLRAFGSLTSLPAAAVVVVTAAIDVSLLRVPPIATAAGRALRGSAAAYRAALAAADPIPGEHVAHALALGLRAPPDSLAERVAAAVQASLRPPGTSPSSSPSSSAERMASTRTA